MKTDKELQNEIFADFIKAHPELQVSLNNVQHQLSCADKASYASVAIEFAIKWMKDENALKEGLSLPKKLIFEEENGVYKQVTKDQDELR